MKLDKETFSKQKFWFGLGLFFLIWLISTPMVVMSGSEANENAEKAFKAAKQKIESSQPKNDEWVKPWVAHREVFEKQKNKVWKDAWDRQKGMYVWPWEGNDRVRAASLLYPDDPFDGDARTAYVDKFYPQQFEGLEYILGVDPRPSEGSKGPIPLVDFKDGIEAVVPQQKWKEGRTPTREECWLAQEDFWVRKEVLLTLKSALDRIAQFTPVPLKAGEKHKDAVAQYKFRNLNWELNLVVTKGTDDKGQPTGKPVINGALSTIKNVHPSMRVQSLADVSGTGGLIFLLRQGENTYGWLLIEGEPIPYGESRPFRKDQSERLGRIDLTKDFSVEQVFEPENCPIRRIDQIKLYCQAHRTETMKLIPSKIYQAVGDKDNPPAAKEAETPAPGGAGGMMGGGGLPVPKIQPRQPGAGGMVAPGLGGMGNKGEAEVKSPTPINGLERARYLSVTDQCRHMPVNVVLVVEQSYINDVLAAFANSPLRVQVTQVMFHHVPNFKPSKSRANPDKEDKGGEAGPPVPRGGDRGGLPAPGPTPPRMVRPGERGGGGMMMAPRMPPMMPPGFFQRPMNPMNPGEGPAAEEGSSLVELSVYGIAALYERFPPKQKTEEQPAGGPANTTNPPARQ